MTTTDEGASEMSEVLLLYNKVWKSNWFKNSFNKEIKKNFFLSRSYQNKESNFKHEMSRWFDILNITDLKKYL